MSVIIKFRRGNSSEWTSSGSTVLASGEPGFELDTGRFKIGDGVTAWSGLYYASIVPTGFIAGSGIDIDLSTNGSYATISVTGHTHSSSDIIDFNSSVSGLLPVKNIVGGTGIYVTATTGNYTIGISGNVLISGLNADLLDGQHGSYYLDWTHTTNKPSPIITGVLTGDVAGTGSVTLSQLSNGTLTINSTIQPNSVALGTDTTGNYVSLVAVSGTGLSIIGSAGEDSTFTVVSNATPANSGGTIISRDSNGNFYATTGNLDVLYFNTSIEPTLSQGQVAWNNTEGTVDIALTNTAIINIGEHEMYRVRNTTSNILYKGQAVYASGVHANGIILPNLYTANGSIREIRFMGLVYENVNDNNNGYVIHFGHINNIDTRGNVASNIAVGDETWSDGDILYVHPTVAGKLTKNEPKHNIAAAIILDAASNGKLFVRPTSYGHLNDNHDVAVSGAANGQFLQYNSATDYWVPSSSGNFTTLLVNGTGVSVSGHAHTVSDITNFNSSVSGLLPTISNSGDNRILTSTGTSTGVNAESNATFDGTTLAISGAITVDNLKLDGNTISSTNSDGNIIISPSGTGALQRDSGGDVRGQYAVDWQTARSFDTMVAGGNYSVIGGGGNNSTSNNNYATIGGGYNNSASGSSSDFSTIGGGYSNSVSGNYSGYSTIGGGINNSVSGSFSTRSTIGGGNNNSVNGSNSGYGTICGGDSNSINATYSNNCNIGGGSNNSIIGNGLSNSTIGGGSSNSVSGYGSPSSTIGGGNSNSISSNGAGVSTIGGGAYNSVSGYGSSYSTIGGGKSNSVSGSYSSYSTIGGGSSNSVGENCPYSIIPGGTRAKTTRYGELSHATGRFNADGDAQHTILIARRTTTNATANQVLFLDASSARLTLPAETTWTFSIKLSAYNDTDNQGGWWIFRGGIRRNAANGTALIGSLITESGTESSLSTASASVVADDTNEALEIRVTGVASKNIRWVAVVDISQVSYGTP